MSTTPELIVPLPALAPARAAVPPIDGPMLIVGLGSIGRRHLANLQALGVEVVLHRTGLGRREAYLPDVAIETDLEAALRRRPAAAIICNPSALHVPAALAAARAGCPLFLEKPVSHSMDGISELQGEIERHRLTAAVGFQFRFHPTLRQIREWIAVGEIGDVVSIRAHWGEYLPDWHPGEDYRQSYSARRDLGGGVILTLCHPFDYVRWLAGDVVQVSAIAGRGSGLELDVEDVAQIALRFASGAVGAISLDYAERPASHQIHVVGRRGSIHWSGRDGVAWLHAGTRTLAVPPPRGFSRNDMFVAEMRQFLTCLESQAEPACTFADGVAALRLALAAKLSAERGKVVDV
jgi:predicted dehydrogenase